MNWKQNVHIIHDFMCTADKLRHHTIRQFIKQKCYTRAYFENQQLAIFRIKRHALHELFVRSSHWTDRVPRDHSAANSEPAVFLFVWKCLMILSLIYLPVKLFKIILNKVLCLSHSYFDVISDGNQIGLFPKRSQYYHVEQFDRKITKD